jgi:hypothetical protein
MAPTFGFFTEDEDWAGDALEDSIDLGASAGNTSQLCDNVSVTLLVRTYISRAAYRSNTVS